MNTIPDEQQKITTLRNLPHLSDTTPRQSISEFSDVTINNTQNFTITTDSNVLQIPIHNITQNTNNDFNQNDTNTISNRDNTFTLYIANTNITQPSQTQQPSPRNCDPPPLPPQYATHYTLHNSLQQSSFKTNDPDTFQIQPLYNFKGPLQQDNQFYKL